MILPVLNLAALSAGKATLVPPQYATPHGYTKSPAGNTKSCANSYGFRGSLLCPKFFSVSISGASGAGPCCDRKPGVEVYGTGRYFTVTGRKLASHPLDLFDCQGGLDALLASLAPVALPAPTFTPPPASDVTERARAYLATVDPAISGQGGHGQTFRAACVLVVRFAISPDAAYPLLAEWNQRCLPPWNEKELRHKLADADKQTGPRGDLLTERIEDPGVNIGPLLATLTRLR